MRARGFTFVELLVTIAILALLAGMAWPIGQLASKRTREADLRYALREIRRGIDAYKEAAESGHVKTEQGASGYPPDLQTLVEGVEDAQDPKAEKKIYFMRRIPRDPLFPDPSAPPAGTWGLRSYASPPDAPAAGEDVFDVYSLSQAEGLNGVPYREW
ncbi:MAG: type II secretion system protein [Gammaproteobacteria bacterium]|nr:type II secretion system protein [Gammaproteobacteria bacterium]